MTQIIFNVDPKIKAKAMKRAKREGVAFSAILKVMARGYAEGRYSLDIEETVRPEKLRQWEKTSREFDQGKGITHKSIADFRKYLKSL